MSEHHDAPKTHEFHTAHEDHTKGPSNPKEINPKVSLILPSQNVSLSELF